MKRNKQLALFLSVIAVAMVVAVIHSSPAQSVGSFTVTKPDRQCGFRRPQEGRPYGQRMGKCVFSGRSLLDQ